MKLSKKQARIFLVNYHHLTTNSYKGCEGIMAYIHQVGSIQFDPLDQVGYNPHLVLQSRVKDYKKEMLYELLYEKRTLVDGWDKCLSIYPIEDWPSFERYHTYSKDGYKIENEKYILGIIRETIIKQGPICSSDISLGQKTDWYWAPTSVARAALEYMYNSGELLIHHKKGTRKYYDLTERILPKSIKQQKNPFSVDQDFYDWQVYRRIGAVGLLWNKASDAFLGIRGFKANNRNQAFSNLLERGLIEAVEIEGIDTPLYYHRQHKELLNLSINQQSLPVYMNFLAPLDNMLWDRKLINALFEFDYKWEVYTPKEERKFGYYVLPILYKDRLVGRIEPSYNRKTNELTVKNIWWESSTRKSKTLHNAFERRIRRFQKYLGAKNVKFDV